MGMSEVAVPDVSGDDLHGIACFDRLQPAPVVEGVVECERGDACVLAHQQLDQVGSDETIRPGHEYAPARPRLQLFHPLAVHRGPASVSLRTARSPAFSRTST